MKKLIFLLIVLLSMNLFSVDLQYFLEKGIAQSDGIRKQMIDYESSQSQLKSAWLNFLPEVNASMGKTWLDNPGKSSSLTISKTISLNEPTYWNFRQTAISKKVQELSLADFKKQLSYQITSSYISILTLQKRMEIEKENYSIQQKTHSQVLINFQNQQNSVYDLKQSTIDTLDAYMNILDLENQTKKARINLFNLINEKDNTEQFSEVGIALSRPSEEQVDSYALLILKQNIKSSELSLTQSKIDYLPTLTLSYNYGKTYVGPPVSDNILAFSDYKKSNTLALTASYSLWNFWRHGEEYYRTKNSYMKSKIELEGKMRDHKANLAQLLADWDQENRSYTLYIQKEKLAQENLEIAQEKFRLGLIDLLELDRARMQYLNSKSNRVDKFYKTFLLQKEIEQAKAN